MVDFKNTQIAFESKSDTDLRRAKLLFGVIKSPSIVKCCKYLSEAAIKLHVPVGWLIKRTLYRHFVGGETLEDCSDVSQQLMKYHVRSICDYSAEGGDSAEDIQRVYYEIERSIDYAMGNRNIAYAVFKPTTLISKALLEKYSNSEVLSVAEIKGIATWKDLFEQLCRRAYNSGVRLLVDAEDYCYQNAIDQVTDEMMRLYNKKRAIVFTTFQMYRRDRYDYLERLYAEAVNQGFIVGMKFVRGAYMEEERLRAQRLGYPDPIYATKAETDANYNHGLEFTITHIDHFEVFAGTHNEESNRYLMALMQDNGLQPDDQRVFFAQLYGMSDNLSYNLANAGYNVAKYIPYAEVLLVLPYLIRRAEENSAMLGQTTRELNFIEQEMKRRKQVK